MRVMLTDAPGKLTRTLTRTLTLTPTPTLTLSLNPNLNPNQVPRYGARQMLALRRAIAASRLEHAAFTLTLILTLALALT